jgi:two-component system, OmpR family, response regulator MtrA
MGITALLVEDDARIREALSLALADEDIEVTPAVSGEQALELAREQPTDVVLLDLMLPGVDGLTVCRTLRDRGELPIIIITARSDTRDVIAGLEAGADDYVTKPLVAGELAARVRALLRRRAPQGEPPPEQLRVGELTMRPRHGVVTKGDQPLHLTRTEFRLLLEILGGRGRIVTREELLHRVWGYDYFGDTRLLDVHIRRLRRKVEDNPDRPDLIRTVRGVGYQSPPP